MNLAPDAMLNDGLTKQEAAPFRYLDLSGYAFTGKSAVIDLMREFTGYSVAYFQFEFALLRMQGGIRDLEAALVEDWSPIRSDAAIRRFRRLVTRLGTTHALSSPRSWFLATGWNYGEYFPGFIERSQAYLRELIDAEWRADWPYPMGEMGSLELFARKVAQKLRLPRAMDVRISLAAPTPARFQEATQRYLADLMQIYTTGSKVMTTPANVGVPVRTVVMHNTCEPFNPGKALNYFHNARSIIVDRDPRDNYVAGLWYRPTRLPPELFVKRYRLYRELAQRHRDPPGRVMRLRFEDLVLDYGKTLPQILEFLGENPAVQVEPRSYFDPAVSAKNVGIWRAHPDQAAIALIKDALPEFCHDGT